MPPAVSLTVLVAVDTNMDKLPNSKFTIKSKIMLERMRCGRQSLREQHRQQPLQCVCKSVD